jgi:hypothetical protein
MQAIPPIVRPWILLARMHDETTVITKGIWDYLKRMRRFTFSLNGSRFPGHRFLLTLWRRERF